MSIAWNRKSACQIAVLAFADNYHRPLDDLATFETASQSGVNAPARYAIRQALDQEYRKYLHRQNADARQARYKAGGGIEAEIDVGRDDKEITEPQAGEINSRPAAGKRDFFGRIINEARQQAGEDQGTGQQETNSDVIGKETKVWVSFHEGFSNAVRKPITLEDIMQGF